MSTARAPIEIMNAGGKDGGDNRFDGKMINGGCDRMNARRLEIVPWMNASSRTPYTLEQDERIRP